MLHPDRLLPADPATRAIARAIYETVCSLPIVSPHGHTDPEWFAVNRPFGNPVELLVTPDHYLFRMLYSRGVPLLDLGIQPALPVSDNTVEPRTVWRTFAANYRLFRGTPSQMWLNHVFAEVFGIEETLTETTADSFYDRIDAALASPAFLPRALFERFDIEFLATTESPLDTLAHHDAIRDSGWQGRVVTTFRPDPVVDPQFEGFPGNLERLAALTGIDVNTYGGYLDALRDRRAYFRERGATATDHGHPTPGTANLGASECERLYGNVRSGSFTPGEAELFRAQMLTEMAAMSVDDGMVMQIHPGSFRNHNAQLFRDYGRDMGADIPMPTDYVNALKPLLDRFGNEPSLTVIVFTLDESTYSRELAPLAGHWPALRLGPAWWFHDSPEGMRRFREQATETAGFYNTVGFNDDTRAFLSIPARHDMSRRIDAGFLAGLVAEHRIGEDEAFELARLLAYDLVKEAYRIQ